MTHFSALSLLRHSLSGNKQWQEQWQDAEPKKAYDAIIRYTCVD